MARIAPASAAAVSLAAVAAGALIGSHFGPQDPRAGLWYLRLRKPRGTPPGPVIGGIWSVLYVLLALCGFRLLRSAPGRERTAALGCWGLTVTGTALYPWTFFGQRRLDRSLASAAALLGSATGTAVAASRIDAPATACMVPVVAWVGLANLLAEELWRRNR
jgi:tryptophan-rich sensory protein